MPSVALVLAGGASRRMGQDKLQLPWCRSSDKPIARRVVEVAETVADEVWVIAAQEAGSWVADLASPAQAAAASGRRVRVVRDAVAYQGPLQALGRAWPRPQDLGGGAEDAVVFVIAADLPGLQPAVLEACRQALLAADTEASPDGMASPNASGAADAACVVRDGRLQPLLGCYRLGVGCVLRQAAQAGEFRILPVLETLAVLRIDADAQGWPVWWTKPVHTPGDYQAWLAWVEAEGCGPTTTDSALNQNLDR